MRLHLLSSLQEGSFYTLFLVLPLFIGGMGAKEWLRVGRIRVYMMREVFEVVGVVGGGILFVSRVCLGFRLVCLCCPRNLVGIHFGGVVGSIESVFLCGWELSVVISVCLAMGAV